MEQVPGGQEVWVRVSVPADKVIEGNRAGRCFGGGFRFHNGFRMQGRRRWFEDNTMDNRNVYPYTRQELEAQKQEIEGQLSWLNEQMQKIKDE